MSLVDLEQKIESLKEWEKMAKEAEEMVDSIKDELKKEMTKRNTEEMTVGRFIMRYTTVFSNRFDSGAFKSCHADLYDMFTKPTTSRRFTIS